MEFIEDMREAVERLAVFDELAVEPAGLPVAVTMLSDDSVRELISEVGHVVASWQTLQTLLAGVVAQRSTRDRGHGGMAAEGGFRTPVEMIRTITGVTRGEATRAVKVGAALLEGVPGADVGGVDAGGQDAGGVDGRAVDAAGVDGSGSLPWHAPLRDAMLAGRLTQAQYDAIYCGLGEPPARDGGGDVVDAWRLAAEELACDAAQWTVEQLRDHARTLRDLLDEEGAQERLRAQYEARSIRLWRDADGRRRADITFDPEMGEWFESLFGAALRPRRGGPRFVTEGEKQDAAALTDDPRTNEQLAYDLLVDVVRAGALAEAKDVFGAREPGVRLIVMKDAVTGDAVRRDALGRLIATGHTEDGRVAVDGGVIERALCLGGSVEVTVDTCGKPLDVGRLERLFTPAQRLALAVRDGGCMWPGCDQPPAMCESHHCTPWARGGNTDIDDGILLCRFHHMNLHFHGWAIARDGAGRFLLVPPPGSEGRAPAGVPAGDGAGESGAAHGSRGRGDEASGLGGIVLVSKSPLRWRWDPPPERPRWRVARAA